MGRGDRRRDRPPRRAYGSVNALCLLPDGRLASGSCDNTIRLWDVATGAETARLEGHSGSVQRPLPAAGRAARLGLLGQHDPAVGRGDRRRDRPPRRAYECGSAPFACCRTGGSPRAPGTTRSGCGTWRRRRDRPPRRAYECGSGPLPAAGRAARLGLSGTTRSGCGTWRPAPRPPASKGIAVRFAALCLLPDGRLASGSWDNTIRLWDVATGAETARLEGHTGAVRRFACCRTGGSPRALDDNTIRLWDVTTGAETARLEGHRVRFRRCACCRTGGSPRAPGTTRSGCGTWRPAPRPPASRGIRGAVKRCACCRTGGSPRALRTTRSGCGTWRPAPRPPASKGTTDRVERAVRAAGRAARLGL